MAAITSNGTGGGLWSATTTWSGGVVPVAIDTVTIASTDTVTFDRLDTSTTCQSITLNGFINFLTTASTQMWLGNNTTTGNLLTLNSTTCVFSMGTATTPIPAAYTCTLVLAPSATIQTAINQAVGGFPISKQFESYGDPTYHTYSQVLNGYTTGTYDSTLNITMTAGTNTCVFNTDIGLNSTGGDLICFGQLDGTNGYSGHFETLTTSAYNSATKTATFTTNSLYVHNTGCYIFNSTRNVVVTSAISTKAGGFNATINNYSYYWNLYHTQFLNIHGFYGAGSPTIVGSSFVNAYNWGNIYACQMINVYAYGLTWGQAYTQATLSPNIYHCGFINAPDQAATRNIFTNCWFNGISAGIFSGNGSTFNSVVFDSSRFALSGATDCVFNNCTFTHLAQLADQAVGHQFNSCYVDTTVTNITYNNPIDNIWIGGTFSTSGNAILYPNVNTQTFSRLLRIQGANTGALTKTYYLMGTGIQYNSSTVPDSGVFPLPSTSSVVDQFTPLPNIAQFPVTIRYEIPVTAGQVYTFTVPILTEGFTVFPTNTQLYIILTIPGISSQPVSLETVSSNGVWTYLTATATCPNAGFLICDVTIGYYQASSYYYVDFPLGLLTANYVWFNGIPSEQQSLVSGSLAQDVANTVLAANPSTSSAGTMGYQMGHALSTEEFLAANM